MGAGIRIKHAVKKYGDNTVIPDLSMEIREGEFFTLLGPSGCGKTTLLRMIAGFNTIEGGEFYFKDTLLNNLDPAKRNIGMVFQSYAIFPHLNVSENIAFGLKAKKVAKEKTIELTQEYLKLMQLEEFKDRMPDRLSGGQQQRVALARALVVQPDILLMDEPLSNLDANLRIEMRAAIKRIQNKLKITTVYVTHDQEEAMAVSDRIAVMNGGVIQQIGKPKDIYQRPKNLFVATFIGKSNITTRELVIKKGKPFIKFSGTYEAEMQNVLPEFQRPQKIIVAIRPEEFVISPDTNQRGISAVVEDSIFLGPNTLYFAKLESGEFVDIVQESTMSNIIANGTNIKLTVKSEKINLFNEEGLNNILMESQKTKNLAPKI